MARAVGQSAAMYMVAALLTVGCSIAILVMVNSYLWYTTYYYGGYVYAFSNTCYMQTPDSQDSVNLCYYSWAAAGLGLFLSLWLFFMQLCAGRMQRAAPCLVIVCLVGMLWWIGCAITGTIYGQNADDYANNPPAGNVAYADVLKDKQGYRTAVWALAWAEMGIWTLALLLSLKDCMGARGKPQPDYIPPTGGYPTGAYTQPAYQAPPPSYYGPPPGQAPYGAYPPPGYPPASGQSPFASNAPPAGYPMT